MRHRRGVWRRLLRQVSICFHLFCTGLQPRLHFAPAVCCHEDVACVKLFSHHDQLQRGLGVIAKYIFIMEWVVKMYTTVYN